MPTFVGISQYWCEFHYLSWRYGGTDKAPKDPIPPAAQLKKFNISRADYKRMLDGQDGGCAICHALPGQRRLSVDHDHACCPGTRSCGACVRALLCQGCNASLGIIEGGFIPMAIEYIERYKRRSESGALSGA